MESKRRKISVITPELLIQRVLSSRATRNADFVIGVRDLVRVNRDIDRRYVGLQPVIRVNGTPIFVIDKDRETKFSNHQILLATFNYYNTNGEHLVEAMHTNHINFSSNLTCKSSKQNRKLLPRVLIAEVSHH